MAAVQYAYATPTDFTITLASLASSATAGRSSVEVDNTSDKFLDALVQLKVKLQTGTPANDKAVYAYAYASVEDTSVDRTDGVAGTDSAFTHTDPPNLRLLGVVNCPAAGGNTYVGGPWSVAAAFGGVLPPRWGIVVRNFTNVALSATGGDHQAVYRGVTGTVA